MKKIILALIVSLAALAVFAAESIPSTGFYVDMYGNVFKDGANTNQQLGDYLVNNPSAAPALDGAWRDAALRGRAKIANDIAAAQAERDAAIAAKEAEKQSAVAAAAADKATAIAAKDATIATKDAALEAKTAELAEKAARVAALEAHLTALGTYIAGLRGTIAGLGGSSEAPPPAP